MELSMKHLLASLAVLCIVVLPQAKGQSSGSRQIQETMGGSMVVEDNLAPIPGDPGYPSAGAEPIPPGPAAPAPMASSAEPIPPGSPVTAPMASSFGGSDGQWGQYAPPDYEDGLTSVGPCCEICGGGANCLDIWHIEQRVTAWARSKPRGISISQFGSFSGQSVFQTNTVLGTRSTAFDAAAGYGATIRRYWAPGQENRDVYLELAYFGLNTWRERRTVNSTNDLFTNLGNNTTAGYGNLFSPFTDPASGVASGVGGFDRARHQEIYYESRINNVEVNLRLVPRSRPDRIVLHPNGRWRRECQPGIYGSYLFGVRWYSLAEQFNFLSTGRTDIYDNNTGDITSTVNTTGTYDIETVNDLLGLQFGMDLMYRRCLWGWGAEAKVCPSVNFASQRSHVFSNAVAAGDPLGGTDLDEFRYGTSDQVALLGEVSVLGYYEVRPNVIIRASWDMRWAVGMALAAEQLQFQVDPAPRINTNGMIFYQGVSLALIWSR